MKTNLDRFIDLIQYEVNEDIKKHVLETNSHIVLEHLGKPVVDYVVAMVIDNLCSKALIDMDKEITK